MNIKFLLIVSAVLFSSLLPASPWVDMTLGDLAGMHQIIKENTAAAIDKDNPAFAQWLEEGLRISQDKAKQVTTFGGYAATLNYYAAGFRDEHVLLHFDVIAKFWKWPGFAITYSNGDFVVSYVEKGMEFPKVGDLIVAIDGTPTKEMVFKRVFPYLGGTILSSEADLFRATPRVLFDEDNPFLTKLQNCTVVSKGESKVVPLTWVPIAYEEAQKILKIALQQDLYSFTIDDFLNDRGAWISIPRLWFRTNDELQRMQEIVDKISSLRNRDVVVIDVRGNGGGDSTWGVKVLQALYGEAFATEKISSWYSGLSHKYRVSTNNLQEIKSGLLRLAQEHGKSSQPYSSVEQIKDKMENALKNNSSQLVGIDNVTAEIKKKDETAPDFKGQLVFITDENCDSACVEFTSLVLEMPNVLHVGRPTHANSFYGEASNVPLPSKMAKLTFPFSIQYNRKRGFNQDYIPKYRYPGDMRNTKALRSWLIELIENLSMKAEYQTEYYFVSVYQ